MRNTVRKEEQEGSEMQNDLESKMILEKNDKTMKKGTAPLSRRTVISVSKKEKKKSSPTVKTGKPQESSVRPRQETEAQR